MDHWSGYLAIEELSFTIIGWEATQVDSEVSLGGVIFDIGEVGLGDSRGCRAGSTHQSDILLIKIFGIALRVGHPTLTVGLVKTHPGK